MKLLGAQLKVSENNEQALKQKIKRLEEIITRAEGEKQRLLKNVSDELESAKDPTFDSK